MYECTSCGQTYPLDTRAWRCACGGPFTLPLAARLTRADVDRAEPSLWRYANALPLGRQAAAAYFGEGSTPLIERPWGGRSVGFKLDYLFPSGSYKDRGSAVLVNMLAAQGVGAVHEDSSGNAGASLAAYAAAAGIRCTVYVPASGFHELRQSGAIERSPRIYGCQAEACAPFRSAFEAGDPSAASLELAELAPTLAEGIAASNPIRAREVLDWIGRCDGRIVAVSEESLLQALADLAAMGLYVEPTAAVAPAAARQWMSRDVGPGERVCIVLTGTGLKATDTVAAVWQQRRWPIASGARDE